MPSLHTLSNAGRPSFQQMFPRSWCCHGPARLTDLDPCQQLISDASLTAFKKRERNGGLRGWQDDGGFWARWLLSLVTSTGCWYQPQWVGAPCQAGVTMTDTRSRNDNWSRASCHCRRPGAPTPRPQASSFEGWVRIYAGCFVYKAGF